MIAVNQMPQIKAIHQSPDSPRDRSEGWSLTLWVGEAFNFDTPFRSILEEVVARLSVSADCTLSIPAHRDGEDFVEGKIDWGTDTFTVYYEYSLGYLDLSSLDRRALERLSDALSNIIVVNRKSA
jgi:hypothetical protein